MRIIVIVTLGLAVFSGAQGVVEAKVEHRGRGPCVRQSAELQREWAPQPPAGWLAAKIRANC